MVGGRAGRGGGGSPGYLRSLCDTLEKVTGTVDSTVHPWAVNAADDHKPPPRFHRTRDIFS